MQTIEKPPADHPPLIEAELVEGASGEGCGRDVAVMALVLAGVATLVWWLL